MALADILQLSHEKETKKIGLSQERLIAAMPIARQYIAYWREYPDMFVDYLCLDNPEHFQLFFYQRVFLRAAMRHRYTYATFPRAFEESANKNF